MNELILQEIKQKLYNSYGRINQYALDSNKDLIEEIKKITHFLNENSSLSARIYCIKNNITERPLCKICNKEIEFKKYYAETCSRACSNTIISRKTASQRSQTLIEKNKGKTENIVLEHFNKINVNKEYELIEININQEIIIFKCLKCNNINKKSFWALRNYPYCTKGKCRDERTKISNLENIGVENVFQLESVKEKSKNTIKEKYNVENISQSNEWKNQWKNEDFKNKKLNKEYNTKKENKTFTTSALEDSFKLLLENNNINYISNFKSDKYPFKCDFYLKDYDIYIELQFHWSHGIEPFILNEIKHEEIKSKWANMNTEYYNKAIKTWVTDDVLKRNTAIKENLKYVEVFNKNNLIKLIDLIKNNEISGYLVL